MKFTAEIDIEFYEGLEPFILRILDNEDYLRNYIAMMICEDYGGAEGVVKSVTVASDEKTTYLRN